MNWTPEQILALAPDPNAARDVQKRANPSKWTTLGTAVQPYQERIDLTEPAFKCSCPSHQFPCKHGSARQPVGHDREGSREG